MIEAASLSKNEGRVPKSDAFHNLAKKYKCQLKEIHDVSVYLQTEGRSISESIMAFQALKEMIDVFNVEEDHEFYKCNHKSNHTSSESYSKKDKDFSVE